MYSVSNVFSDNRCQVHHHGPGPRPQPGEIWRIHRDLANVLPSSCTIESDLLSEPALRFLEGHGSPRHVMIVGDIRLLSHYSLVLDGQISGEGNRLEASEPDRLARGLQDQHWVTAMVFGNSLNSLTLKEPPRNGTLTPLSKVDVLIPAALSGLNHPVIAETWHIVPVLITQLCCAEGHRFSSTLYNHLMEIGDTQFKSSLHRPNADGSDQAIPSVALSTEDISSPLSPSQIQSFHHYEQEWSEVLRLPITVCQIQLEQLKTAASIINRAMWIERSALQ